MFRIAFLVLAFYWSAQIVIDVVNIVTADPKFSAGWMALDVIMAVWMWHSALTSGDAP